MPGTRLHLMVSTMTRLAFSATPFICGVSAEVNCCMMLASLQTMLNGLLLSKSILDVNSPPLSVCIFIMIDISCPAAASAFNLLTHWMWSRRHSVASDLSCIMYTLMYPDASSTSDGAGRHSLEALFTFDIDGREAAVLSS